MSRRLAPLTQRVRVGGTLVSFPMVLHASTRASAFVALPRRAAAGLLPDAPFSLVPVAPRAVGCQVTFAEWTDSPVGSFREVSVSLAVYAGTGSPVPGLAPILHSLMDRTDIVGDYGFLPVVSLVDRPEAAVFREELWGIDAHVEQVRWQSADHGVVAQVEHEGDPVLRVSASTGGSTETPGRVITAPTYGVDADGVPWHDLGRSEVRATARRFRAGAGHVAIYPTGPLRCLGQQLDADPSDGFTRRSRIAEVTTDEHVRWAGPRRLEDLDAADGSAFTGG